MKDFYQYISIVKDFPNHAFVMATIVHVEGSAYRHEGAKMLICETGEKYGLISGGCLEEDIQFHADEVIQSQKSKIVLYDLRAEDDLGWGQGAGCNGSIQVLLEPIQWSENHYVLSDVVTLLNMGENVTSIHVEAERLYFSENGVQIGGDSPSFMESIVPSVRTFLRSETRMEYKKITGIDDTILFEKYESKDMLYIFGAGPDVEPIVKRAVDFHFAPIVIDPSEVRCNRKYFEKAEKLICKHPSLFLQQNNVSENSYVLIMTHNFLRDQEIMAYFLKNPVKYVGILGPRKRTERLIQPNSIPCWVSSPVGMDIFAEGADEISISVLGELIKVRNEKEHYRRKNNRENVLPSYSIK
ncbi:XdhC family protein [Evansella sp. AB-rgal1]|uniref:XdhC family protein n=1 Tax=Evansella sp. AB-rgal1 TaxID=3242696 RepID=UPI00359EB5E5